MLKVNTDAAVNGNPGQAGVGFIVSGPSLYEQVTQALDGQWDNHQAEFQAIIQALTWLNSHGHQSEMIFIYSDSKTAVDLLHKGFSKNQDFQLYLDQIYQMEKDFHFLSIDWIPSSQNRGADHLARQALQQARKKK